MPAVTSPFYDELLETIEEHRLAVVTGDVAKLDFVLADSFVHTNSLGGTREKQEHLKLYKDKTIQVESIVFDTLDIYLSTATVAVVCIRARAVEQYAGEDRSDLYQLSRVYVYQDRWRCIMNHGHRVV